MKQLSMAVVLAALVTFGIGLTPALAQHDHDHEQEHGEEGAGHSHARAQVHGGAVTMSKEFHVETVFLPDQIRLYLYDGTQNPMHVKHWKKGLVEASGDVQFRDGGRGTATLEFTHAAPGGYACPMCAGQESGKPGKCAMCGMELVKEEIPDGTLWSCPMHPDENGKGAGKCDDCGMKLTPQDYLMASVDLKGLEAGGARATLSLKNLPGEKEQTLQFTEKFVPAKAHDEQEEGEQEHDEHDHSGHGHGSSGH